MTQNSTHQDLTISCKSCQKDFIWTKKEQEYYQKKGFRKKPQKCNTCREKANKLRDASMYYVHCGLCPKDAKMLTPPPKDRVAICQGCFEQLAKTLQPKA